MPREPGTRPIRPAPTACEAIGEAEHAGRIAYGMPDVLGRERARYAGKTVAVLGAGHSAVGTILDLARLKEAEPRHADRLAAARRQPGEVVRRRRQRQAGRARRARAGLRRARAAAAASASRPDSGSRTSAANGGKLQARRRLGLLRPARRGRRADRRDRLPSRPVVPARAAHRARSGARMPARSWRR